MPFPILAALAAAPSIIDAGEDLIKGIAGLFNEDADKIKEALDRIESKTYGVCEDCSENIGEARLKARPVTTLCIDCKKRQETDEKAKGL